MTVAPTIIVSKVEIRLHRLVRTDKPVGEVGCNRSRALFDNAVIARAVKTERRFADEPELRKHGLGSAAGCGVNEEQRLRQTGDEGVTY